jgi:hypothetical protein
MVDVPPEEAAETAVEKVVESDMPDSTIPLALGAEEEEETAPAAVEVGEESAPAAEQADLPAESPEKQIELTAEEKQRKDKEHKEKYKDWPMKNIEEPHDNDVLYGRGGKCCSLVFT